MTVSARAQYFAAVALPKQGRFPVAPKADRTFENTVFASKREMMRFACLRLMERAGKIRDLKPHPTFNIEINGQHFCRFTPDSTYWCNERKRQIYEDVKSSGTAGDTAYRLRRKACELAHHIQITEVL